MATPTRRLNEIKRKSESNNFPSEADLRFVSNHITTHPVSGRLRKFLEIPTKERINLRFIRGSRHPLQAMPIANLRLLNKHRRLFPKNSTMIHETLLNRENPQRVQNFAQRYARLKPSEQLRFNGIPFTTVALNKLSANNIKFLNEHRNLFPPAHANRIHAEHLKRTDPLTPAMKESIQILSRNWTAHMRAEQKKIRGELLAQVTKGNMKKYYAERRAGQARERNENIRPTPKPKMLNWNRPKNYFESTLQFKSINNANVQNVMKRLKAYRNEHHPTKNNMPARPNRPTKLTIENKRKYNQNMREYDQAIRRWIMYMANIRRQNKT
jgi:hypothetical protein